MVCERVRWAIGWAGLVAGTHSVGAVRERVCAAIGHLMGYVGTLGDCGRTLWMGICTLGAGSCTLGDRRLSHLSLVLGGAWRCTGS